MEGSNIVGKFCTEWKTFLLTLCSPGNFFFLLSADFCYFFRIPSECQTDWFQIRPDVLSGLIWVNLFVKVISMTTQERKFDGS